MNAFDSGHAIAAFLNTVTIILNLEKVVKSVEYADSTDELLFNVGDLHIIFPRENFTLADWDEDHNEESFYSVLDNEDIVHSMRFYRNDSLELMRQMKMLF